MEIERCLVLSTAHLGKKDVSRLGDGFPSVPIMDFPEGYNVCANWEDEHYTEFSPSFRKLVKLAKSNNCKWLLFDRDGDVIEGYKVYEW